MDITKDNIAKELKWIFHELVHDKTDKYIKDKELKQEYKDFLKESIYLFVLRLIYCSDEVFKDSCHNIKDEFKNFHGSIKQISGNLMSYFNKTRKVIRKMNSDCDIDIMIHTIAELMSRDMLVSSIYLIKYGGFVVITPKLYEINIKNRYLTGTGYIADAFEHFKEKENERI